MYNRFKVIGFFIFQAFLSSIYAINGYCSAAAHETLEAALYLNGQSVSSAYATHPGKIVISSDAKLTPSGLVIEWKTPPVPHALQHTMDHISQVWKIPTVQEVLDWTNKINTVHRDLKQFYTRKRLAQRHEFTVPSPRLDVPFTATDAMAQYRLGADYIEGDDAGNSAKLLACMQDIHFKQLSSQAAYLEESSEEIKQLFQRSMKREREHPDHVAMYHGVGGEVAFLYTFYKTLANLLMPEEHRKVMPRAFDKRFFSMLNTDAIYAEGKTNGDHLLCANFSVLDNWKAQGNNSTVYAITGGVCIGQDLKQRLRHVFHGFGIDLPDADMGEFLSLYEQYFILQNPSAAAVDASKLFGGNGTPTRGLLLQIFLDAQSFTQNVRVSYQYDDNLVPSHKLDGGSHADHPSLHFIKKLRRGHTEDLKAADTADFSEYEFRVSMDPRGLNDKSTESYSDYYPPLPRDEERTLVGSLRQALSRITSTHPIKHPETLLYPVHHQFLALKHLLQDHANVQVKRAPLEDTEVIGFFNEATPEEVAEYVQDHPEFLDREVRVNAKDLNTPATNPDGTVSLSAKALLLNLAFMDDSFTGKGESHCAYVLGKILEENPDAYNLSDPHTAGRISYKALRVPSLQKILIAKGIWGAKPIYISDYSGERFEIYPSLAHYPTILSHPDNFFDLRTSERSPLEQLFQSKEFKAYVLSLEPPTDETESWRDYKVGHLHLALKRLGWTSPEITHFFSRLSHKYLPYFVKHDLVPKTPEFARRAVENLKFFWLTKEMYRDKEIIPNMIQKLCDILPAEERPLAWEKILKRISQNIDQDIIDFIVDQDTAFKDGDLVKLALVLKRSMSLGIPVPPEVGIGIATIEYVLSHKTSQALKEVLALLPQTPEYIQGLLASSEAKPIGNIETIGWILTHREGIDTYYDKIIKRSREINMHIHIVDGHEYSHRFYRLDAVMRDFSPITQSELLTVFLNVCLANYGPVSHGLTGAQNPSAENKPKVEAFFTDLFARYGHRIRPGFMAQPQHPVCENVRNNSIVFVPMG